MGWVSDRLWGKKSSRRKKRRQRRYAHEQLEARLLLCSESAFWWDGTLPGPAPVECREGILGLEGGVVDEVPEPASTAPFALDETFKLHSRDEASKTIYLDFDGHVTSGTAWNKYKTSNQAFSTPAYSFEGGSSFSDSEKARIQRIWQRVVEDFAPFDVNVTTEDPGADALRKRGHNDTEWGVRVLIGGASTDWYGDLAGGVAYLTSFNYSTDTPAFVFPENLGNGAEKAVAEAISHEIGHALNLYHDGLISPSRNYYRGHGSGATGWAPIMGVGYDRHLTQWSKGEYAGANQHEDDLNIITTQNGFGFVPDDHADSFSEASPLDTTEGAVTSTDYVSGQGVISQRTDRDVFYFEAGAGPINLYVDPVEVGPNLDILATLYDETHTKISESNPADELFAELSKEVEAGTYYLKVDGIGRGSDYTDYGSLGQYSIRGIVATPKAADATAPTAVAQAFDVLSSSEFHQFTVTYSDDTAIAIDDLDDADVLVTGDGFDQHATFVAVDRGSNGSPRRATYRIQGPDGGWDATDNGLYTINMKASEVGDPSGNTVAAGVLGTFRVDIDERNLALTEIYLINGLGERIDSPLIGEEIAIRADYRSANLPADAEYRIDYVVDGVTLHSGMIDLGAGYEAGNWFWYRHGWFASEGEHHVEVRLDAGDNVDETNEKDNLLEFSFTPVQAEPPSQLVWPLIAEPFRDVTFVNYVDLDPLSGVRDYNDGSHSYNGHDALDLTTYDFGAMDDRIRVVASASGVVKAVDDGHYDRNTGTLGEIVPGGLPNYVVVDHGQGWETHYLHLRRDSVSVAVGQEVRAGDLLGYLGSSGYSTGAHLHFTVKHHGLTVATYLDPHTYWVEPQQYVGDQVALMDFGISNYDPTPHITERPSEVRTFKQGQSDSPHAFVWLSGIRQQDEIEFVWRAPREPGVVLDRTGEVYETITAAIGAATDGDVLLVRDGVYHETLTIDKAITIEAEHIGGAIVDGGGAEHLINVRRDTTLRGIHLRNAVTGINQRDVGVNYRCERCIASNMVGAAFSINNTAARNGTAEIVNTLIYDSGTAAAINDGGTIKITNSILDNVRHAFGLHNGNGIIGRNNILHRVVDRGTSGAIPADPEEIIGDPLFLDRAGGDYRLSVNSRAIDSGEDIGLPFEGDAPDRGPFEFGVNEPDDSSSHTITAGRDYALSYWWSSQELPPDADPGTWSVEVRVNGQSLGKQSFEVSEYGSPELRIERGTPDHNPQADLVVSDLRVVDHPTYDIAYEYVVTNVGDAAVELDGPTGEDLDNVSVQAFLSADTAFQNEGDLPAGGTILGNSPLGLLLPGESLSGSFGATVDFDVTTHPFLTLQVDSGKVVRESDESNNTAAARIEPTKGTSLLTSTRDGIALISADGSHEIVVAGTESNHGIEVLERGGFAVRKGGHIVEIDERFDELRRIPIPAGLESLAIVALTEGRYALLSNRHDEIYFLDSTGALLHTAKIRSEPDSHLQNVDGIQVGNRLIVSEDGSNHLLAVDLATYHLSLFKDLSEHSGWLSAIDYHNGTYYVLQSRRILEFTGDGPATTVAELPEGNLTGIHVDSESAFVTVNFTGKVYEVDLATGNATLHATELNYPSDLEPLPETGRPDLRVTGLRLVDHETYDIAYEYTVQNSGTAAADLSQVAIQALVSADPEYGTPGDRPAGGRVLDLSGGTLLPGATITQSFGATVSYDVCDHPFLAVQVDSTQQLLEASETNNSRSVLIHPTCDATRNIVLDDRYTPIDFGETLVGSAPVTQVFTVVNHGSAPLLIDRIDAPAGFEVVAGPESVEVGEERAFTVSMQTDHAGYWAGQVRVYGNDRDESEYNFSVEGTVISPRAPHPLRLSELDGEHGFVIRGVDADDQSGTVVSGIGDINDDGYADLAIAAPFADPNAVDKAGEVYVVLGTDEAFGDGFDLANLDGGNGFSLTGTNTADFVGTSLSAAGDLNGDGIDDLVIGANRVSPFRGERLYDVDFDEVPTGVIPTQPKSHAIPLPLPSVVIVDSGDSSGTVVASAADLNDQPVVLAGVSEAARGLATLALEMPEELTTGVALVRWQSAVTAAPPAGEGFRTEISVVDATTHLPSALDVRYGSSGVFEIEDADGVHEAGEFIVGVSAQFALRLDLDHEIYELHIDDEFVSSGELGVEGDLYSIVMHSVAFDPGAAAPLVIDNITVDWTPSEGTRGAGEAYVLFGRKSDFASRLPLSSLDGNNGFVLQGVHVGDGAGVSVSSAGDFNGDGVDDLLVGAAGVDSPAADDVGRTYLVYGRPPTAGFDPVLDLGSLDGSNGFAITGSSFYDLSGSSVSLAGDVNADGYDDIIIGAPLADPNDVSTAGEAYVLYGRAAALPTPAITLDNLSEADGFVITGEGVGDRLGVAVSSGDFNGDGFSDVLLGAEAASFGNKPNVGVSYVIFGGESLSPTVRVSSLDGENGVRIAGINSSDVAGRSVSFAGDLNADGYDDVLISAELAAPEGNRHAGETYVVFGRPQQDAASIQLSTLDGRIGFSAWGANEVDFAGMVSGVDDFDNDGFSDFIIGARHADPGERSSAGESYLIYGGSSGLGDELVLGIRDRRINEFGETVGSVRRSGDLTEPITVKLVNHDPTELLLPERVTIPAGEASTIFSIGGVDDQKVDGPQIVSITAVAAGLAPAHNELDVVDLPLRLTLEVEADVVSEAAGSNATTAVVSRGSADDANPLVVTLTTSDDTEAALIGSVVIPAGQSEALVPIDAVDDELLDGTQTVRISASASGFLGAKDYVDVTDHEQLRLVITTESISEADGANAAQATVYRSRSDGSGDACATPELTVTLSSSDTTEATVPTTVVFACNQLSAGFAIDAVDDEQVDGTQTVTIGATGGGYLDGTRPLDVTDHEPLVVQLASQEIREDDGTRATTATVTRQTSDLSKSLDITLTSDDDTEATVAETITIPVGSKSATFDIDAVDDNLLDGTQEVTIRVTAAGFASTDVHLSVTDHEFLSLSISDDEIGEGDGPEATTAVVARSNTDTAAELVVVLASDLPGEASVQQFVTIPSGQMSETIPIAAVAEEEIDGHKTVTIAAAAKGYVGASDSIVVLDDDDNGNQAPELAPVGDQIIHNTCDEYLIELSAIDPDGDAPLTYSVTVQSTPGVTFTVSDTTLIARPTDSFTGSVEVTVSVSDGQLSDSDSFTVTVVDNESPALDPIADQTMATTDDTLEVQLAFEDPDGDALDVIVEAEDYAHYLDRTLNLNFGGSYYENEAGLGERWLTGTGGWYYITPDGALHRWVGGSYTNTEIVAQLTPALYEDPSLLHDAPLVDVPVELTLFGSRLVVDPADRFVGNFAITVTVSDLCAFNSDTFVVTMLGDPNTPPEIDEIPDQSIAPGGIVTVELSASDRDDDPLTFTATVETHEYVLDQELGLSSNGEYFEDDAGLGEKWMQGTSGWYYITPDGTLHQWLGGPLTNTAVVATLTPDTHANPTTLHDAISGMADAVLSVVDTSLTVEPGPGFLGTLFVTVSVTDGLAVDSTNFLINVEGGPPVLAEIGDQAMTVGQDRLTLELSASDPDDDPLSFTAEVGSYLYYLDQELELSFAGYFEDEAGRGEKWILGGAGWYYITPDGVLHQWLGGPYTNTVVAATLDPSVHADPAVLHDAEPDQPPVAIGITGNVLILDPARGFGGNFLVTVTVSDGILEDSETFLVSGAQASNSAPIIDPIPDRSMSAADDSIELQLAVNDPDGDPVTLTAELELYEYVLDQELGLRFSGGYFEDDAGLGEKWVLGNAGWYYITPDGTLHQWLGGPLTNTAIIASLSPATYADPALLHDAQPDQAQATVTVANTTLTVDPDSNFTGTLQITVTASDGLSETSESALVVVEPIVNTAPVLDAISDQTVSATQGPIVLPLSATDSDGDPLVFTAAAESAEYALDQQFGLRFSSSYYEDSARLGEKWLLGNANIWYYVTPDGNLHEWLGGPYTNTRVVGRVSQAAYDDPALLHDAQPGRAPAVTSVSGSVLTIDPSTGFVGSFVVTVGVSDGFESDSQTMWVTVLS